MAKKHDMTGGKVVCKKRRTIQCDRSKGGDTLVQNTKRGKNDETRATRHQTTRGKEKKKEDRTGD